MIRSIVILGIALMSGTISSKAQPLSDASFSACLDNCDRNMALCLGESSGPGPNSPIPPDGLNNVVPTPAPFEQCLFQRDQCVVGCQSDFNRMRRESKSRR